MEEVGRVKGFKVICLIAIVGMFTGCAAREDIIILANRTQALERNLNQLRDKTEDNQAALTQKMDQMEKRIGSQLQPVLRNQAEAASQVEALKVQLQSLQGRIEVLEHNQEKGRTQLTEAWNKEIKDLQARLQKMEKAAEAVPPPPPLEGAPKAEKFKEPAKEAKEEPRETKEATKATAGDPVEEGLTLLKKQSYEGAKKKFEEYLKNHPKGKRAEEAQFGLGEALYWMKENEEAILTYQKLIKAYPKSKYIPEALYKQALAFLRLKDQSSARLLLEKIVKEYPKSPQAKQAKSKLAAL